ncbi:serine/threonine protein kinase [Legionella qingyii]|uniref:Serine/threonine protein kinase n=1 Tax=Legionella qingyii TaxID=2184757 RepID=A0A317TY94_9GAMM|nr:protein kinase [Legionella qingyii]PWY53785.1 serine/threonine protein kinase [Legionella qingyii]RUR23611.1 serine/threonine protein kinase [Legionella qingyii]RUR24090.1 serine/threonine protein kinase [Legionella qingyii]
MTRISTTDENSHQTNESITLINPTDLTQEQSIFLKEFLEGDDQPEVFLPDTIYTYKEVQFKLTHELNWRLGKDGISDCFEVMKNSRAGIGKYATVDNIEGKLISFSKELEFVPAHTKPHKDRVRKFMFFKQDKEEEQWRDSIKKEYKRTKQAGHLSVRKPVFFRDNAGKLCAYMFIKKASGTTLHDILHDKSKMQLDIATRKTIAIAILNAYIEQVANKGLVHNDISLKNIMIDISNPKQPIVTFIDFAFAKKIHKNDAGPHIRGTPLYMAPERFVGEGSSTASDVFALGHILAELFGEQRITPGPKWGIKEIYRLNKKGTFDSDLIYLEEFEKDTITHYLLPMVSPSPEDRPTPEKIKEMLRAEYESSTGLTKNP